MAYQDNLLSKTLVIGIIILFIGLLISTALTTVGIANIKTIADNPSPIQNGSVDQELTTTCNFGMILSPPYINAQSFKPSKDSLTSVELWFFKSGSPQTGVEITVSIRDSLNGTDLTLKTINTDEVEITSEGTWVYFNFEDITVIPEETYYILCYANGGGIGGNCYCWLYDIFDKYPRGEGWWYNETSATWITLWELFEFDPQLREPDLCFKTYFKDSSICCDGEINLVDMYPEDVRTEYFDIYNCGNDGSELSWKVTEYPEWGLGWTFTPASGTGLTPAAGPVTIQVDFIIPSDSKSTFTGKIIVINSNYPNDYCEISVSLTTPRTRATSYLWYQWLFDRFPFLEVFLRAMNLLR